MATAPLAKLELIRLSGAAMTEARAFSRAGGGNSASPVRRGESGPRLWCRPLSYSTPELHEKFGIDKHHRRNYEKYQ